MPSSKGGGRGVEGEGAGAGASEATKPISMRGRKKHKCSVCGNIAKSRCPFHSCKGCCVKAKNPCHIHVLKSSPAGETAQSFSATPSAHLPAASSIVRHPHPNDSLRLRTVKPLGLITRKEAAFINLLRFQKLRNYTEGVTEAEDQAFDRYMQNVSLLEGIFAGDAESLEGLSPEGHLLIEGISGSEQPVLRAVDVASLSAGLHMRLRSSSKRKEAHRQRLRRAIDRSLQKLNKGDQGDTMLENEDIYMSFTDTRRDMKRIKVQSVEGKERLRKMDVFNTTTEKVKQMENQEDLYSCLKMFEDNFVNRDAFGNPFGSTEEVPGSQEVAPESSQTLDGVGHKESFKEPPVVDKGREVLKLGVFNKARVDSFGVLKSWWKVDLSLGKLDSYVDMPLSMLETL